MRRWLTFALALVLISSAVPICSVAMDCRVPAAVSECDCCVPPAATAENCHNSCALAETPTTPTDALVSITVAHVVVSQVWAPVTVARFAPLPVAVKAAEVDGPPVPADRSSLPGIEPTRGPPARA